MGRGTGIISYLRGKVFVIDQPAYYAGINPAYAGKRIMACVCTQSTQDHPRPCGEKWGRRWPPALRPGSPPPMRGKVWRSDCAARLARITPAHAGKSGEIARTSTWSRDHPRPCGEKDTRSLSAVPAQGSPPPMRGKDIQNIGCIFEHRITPAHAGKRVKYCNAEVHLKDHPRPCGEKPAPRRARFHESGSPPPMRGKGCMAYHKSADARITPAHAGKRAPCAIAPIHSRDHPRPCGEKPKPILAAKSAIGSPPPMRGKEFDWMPNAEAARITPAHAGKSDAPLRRALER